MSKLWVETIGAHRREVRDAILDVTAALVTEHGLRSVTMSQIAERTGIGRATLYKYFSGVEAILLAWHERQISSHLQHLAEVRDQAGNPNEQLEAVLEAYAMIHHEHHGAGSHHPHPHNEHHAETAGTDVAALLHRGRHLARAHQELHGMINGLLAEAAQTGEVRDDVAPEELATYCLHALEAAANVPSKAAVRRLVAVVLAGLRPSL